MTKPFFKLNQTELRELLADNPTPEEKAKYEQRIVYLKNKYQKKKKPSEDSKAKELEMINKHINAVEEPKKSRFDRYVERGLINPNKLPKVPDTWKKPEIVNNPEVNIDIDEEPIICKKSELSEETKAKINEIKEKYRRKRLEEVKAVVDIEPLKEEAIKEVEVKPLIIPQFNNITTYEEAVVSQREYFNKKYRGANELDILMKLSSLMEQLKLKTGKSIKVIIE